MENSFILVEQLSMCLGQNTVLQNISCTIDQGRAVAIIGANGSGKTTFLKILAGILRPGSGGIQIDSLRYSKSQEARRLKKMIGYAPDKAPLYPYDTVNRYLQFIAELKQIPKPERSDRVQFVLEVLDLTTKRNHYIHALSNGMQQRVNLAQSLLNNPQLLILDEPTNGLDPEHCSAFISYLKTLRALHNTTIVIVSHNHATVLPLCDYMLKLTAAGLEHIVLPEHSREHKVIINNDLSYCTT